MDLKLVELTLETVSDGGLESRFQELLGEVAGIHETADAYAAGPDGSIKSVVKLEVEIRHRPAMKGDPATTLIVSGAELKRPKRLKSAQTARTDSEGNLVVVQNPPEQTEAFAGEGSGGILRPLTAPEEKETANHGRE